MTEFKMYSGYRVTEKVDIWELAYELRTMGLIRVREKVKKEFQMWMNDPKFKIKIREALRIPETRELTIFDYSYFAQYNSKEEMPPFNPNVSFTIRKADNILYLLPNNTPKHSCIVAAFEEHPLCEYYGYWDNTDPDESCPIDEWFERRKAWTKVLKTDIWTNYLTVEVSSIDEFYLVDPVNERYWSTEQK